MSEVSDKITQILEDPESLKMISQIAEGFLSDKGNDTRTSQISNTDIENSENNDKLIEVQNNTGSLKLLSELLGKGNVDNSIMLINALKPYMSARRCESADSVLKILKLLKILEKSNMAEISKLINLIK